MVERDDSRDIKKQENERRIKLAMLGLLIEEYPKEAREKIRKILFSKDKITLHQSSSDKISIELKPRL